MIRLPILVGSLVLASIVFLPLLPGAANACSCGTPPPEIAFDNSDGVFSGTALSLETQDDHDVVRFFVIDSWKGVTTRTAYVSTRSSGSECGYTFELGKKYVVFAADQEDIFVPGTGYPMGSHLCSGSKIYDQAEELLEWLGDPGVTPTLPTTWGRIKMQFGFRPTLP